MQVALVNPHKRGGKKRRARKGKSARRASRRSVSARHVYRVARRAAHRRRSSASRRRNPITLNGLKNRLMPAVWGGVGGVATDLAFRVLPVPAALGVLKGSLAPVTRVALAVGVAKVASMFLGGKRADEMLTGSLAIIGYDLLNTYALKFIPVVGAPGVSGDYDFAGVGYVSPGAAVQGTGRALPSGGMAEYISGVGEYISEGSYDFA